jgi:hypothetical protein
MSKKAFPVTLSKSSVQDFLVVIIALLTSVSAFLFIFGLPWNDLGLWRQTETGTALLYSINALLIAAIGGLLVSRNEAAFSAVTARPLIAYFLFGVVGLGCVTFSDNPMRALHGTMKHGVGALWYLELGIMTVSASIVLMSRWKWMLLGASTLATFGIIALYLFGESQPFGLPLGFNEWVGLAGGLAAFPLFLAAKEARGRIVCSLVAASVLILSYYLSDNRTVLLSLAAIGAFAVASYMPGGKRLMNSGLVRASVVVAIMILGLAGAYFAGPLIEKHRLTEAPLTASVLSDNPLDRYDLHKGSLGTIWSRSYMVRIVVEDIIQHPSILLTGRGYGSFETIYERHARELPGRMFVEETPSASMAYWDGHEKSNFHPHNMPVDILYSTGFLGLALWALAFAVMAYQSRRGFYAAVAISVFFTFWFPVNHITMMMALAMAAAIVPGTPSERTKQALSGLSPLMFVMAAALLVLAVFFGRLLIVERNERAFFPVTNGSNPQNCAIYSFPLFPENEITTSLYTLLNRRVTGSKNPADAVFQYTTNYIAFNCMIRNYQNKNTDLVSLVYSLKTRAQFAPLGPKVYGAFSNDLVNWGPDIDRLLDVAPGRTEFLAPYVTTFGVRSPVGAISEIDRYVPRLSETDPVRDYLLFVRSQLDHSPHEIQAQHIQAAVDKGFANIWKISPETIKEFGLK